MIKRKNPLCSGKKGKVFSFQLEAAVTVMTIAHPLRVVSQDALDHMRKTLGRREVRRWYGVPQKSLPGFPLTDPAPHTRDEGGHIRRAVFAPSGTGVGIKGDGMGQRLREGGWVD